MKAIETINNGEKCQSLDLSLNRKGAKKMRKTSKHRIVILIVMSCITMCYAKERLHEQTVERIFKVDLADVDKKLMFGEDDEYKQAYDFLPDDIVIDSNENIYICDQNNNKIQKYDGEMNWSYEINLPNIYFTRLKVGIDKFNNLFVNLNKGDAYGTILKYNSEGKLILEFPSDQQIPGTMDRVIQFKVSPNGNVFLDTFSIDLLRPNWKYGVYMYNSQGVFLGMVDYYAQDLDGNILKIKRDTEGTLITKYKGASDIISTTEDMKIICDYKIDNINKTRRVISNDEWFFVGTDKDNNVYMSNLYKLRVYNKNCGFIEEIEVYRKLYNENKNLIRDNKSVKVSPNGNIYWYGMVSKRNKKGYKNHFKSDLTFEIYKIGWKDE